MANSTGHTPGPWVVDRSADGRTGTRITTAGPMFEGATLPMEVARITKSRGPAGDYMANARLIAAAPQLLAALEALVARCDGAEGVRPDGHNMDTISAHAAIAAATGEQP